MKCFSYFKIDSLASYRSALEDLDAYIKAEGPFDAVMAFSQVASLVATMIAQPVQHNQASVSCGFKCAVFICPGQPLDPIALRRGEARRLDAKVDGKVIRIPTAIIMGSKDPSLQDSLNMYDLCCAQTRELSDHGGGHEVPLASKHITLKMVDAIRTVIDKALSGW